MTISSRTLAGFALSALVAGCGHAVAADAAEAQVAADGSEAMAASSQSTNLAGIVFETVNVANPGTAAAQLGAPTQLWPEGCVTRTKDSTNPDVVHVTFKDCTGPFGLVRLDGEEVVTFSAATSGVLHVVISGTDLSANGKPITYAAAADVSFPTPTTRNVVWRGSWTRTNDRGDTVSHTSDLQIEVDLAAGCSTASGTAGTSVGERQVATSVTDYRLCRDAIGALGCPSGMVTHTGKVSGKTITVKFDGSDVAEVTGPRGNGFPVDLVCTAIGK